MKEYKVTISYKIPMAGIFQNMHINGNYTMAQTINHRASENPFSLNLEPLGRTENAEQSVLAPCYRRQRGRGAGERSIPVDWLHNPARC